MLMMINLFISHRTTLTIPVYGKAHLSQFLPRKSSLLQSNSVFVSLIE